ncbi:hypothetical protein VNO77_21201 [Canavalia gladiata]|uniref:non-specific serine/threonine protein kinase n=1 Tax=Canavalia gladiata TaxID=3824 RepID=A0AAN9LRJ2_CANGL
MQNFISPDLIFSAIFPCIYLPMRSIIHVSVTLNPPIAQVRRKGLEFVVVSGLVVIMGSVLELGAASAPSHLQLEQEANAVLGGGWWKTYYHNYYHNISTRCEWDAIVCNANGSIIEINYDESVHYIADLQFAELNLSAFRNLERLDLSGIGLRGSIPPEIGNHPELTFLEGEIPPSLTNLTKLQTLIISNNNIQGSIPRSLFSVLWDDVEAMELDWRKRISTVKGIAHARSYLHHDCTPSIVHRDISTSNILLNSEWEPSVCDFGIARLLSHDSSNRTSCWNHWIYCSSMPDPYISQADGLLAYTMVVSEKCEAYSFGMVALETLVGRHPKEILL